MSRLLHHQKYTATKLKNLLMQEGSSNRTTRTENENFLMTTIAVVLRAGNQTVIKMRHMCSELAEVIRFVCLQHL
ncbi:MAG: hypothetical protein ACJ71B_11700 [Nitrososphaera sp.]